MSGEPGTASGPASPRAAGTPGTGSPPGSLQGCPPGWSVIVPYFNEEKFLGDTLRALLAQDMRPLTLVLVDNGSTDSSATIARGMGAQAGDIGILQLSELQPGKTHALMAGLAAVSTEFVAICDADTFYPPDFLSRAGRVFAGSPSIAAVLAWGISGNPESTPNLLKRFKGMAAATLMPRQCHSGGYGQSFRTRALRDAGGFSADRWPFVLEDHEIMHRLTRAGGRLGYDFDLWCRPSDRRTDRRKVDWTLTERLFYHLTPFARKDWLFYRFLSARFAARGMKAIALRDKNWETAPGFPPAPPSESV